MKRPKFDPHARIEAQDNWVAPSTKLAVRALKLRKEPGYKVIIAGSRHIDQTRAKKLIHEHWKTACGLYRSHVTHIISGCAPGPDTAGIELALKLTGRDAVKFPADWDGLGKAAGPMRNIDMMSCADALFILWDGKSRGSRHMLTLMEMRNRPVFEIELG